MGHEPQPGFFQQILGDVAAARQAGQKAVEARVERRVDGVERRRLPGPHALDQRQLRLAVHVRLERTDRRA